jgi:hypothetical protein
MQWRRKLLNINKLNYVLKEVYELSQRGPAMPPRSGNQLGSGSLTIPKTGAELFLRLFIARHGFPRPIGIPGTPSNSNGIGRLALLKPRHPIEIKKALFLELKRVSLILQDEVL